VVKCPSELHLGQVLVEAPQQVWCQAVVNTVVVKQIFIQVGVRRELRLSRRE
jgi:hypothetical protein